MINGKNISYVIEGKVILDDVSFSIEKERITSFIGKSGAGKTSLLRCMVNLIQDSREKFDGMIINAAAFTHTSVAIRDALSIFKKPVIELHISNIYKREEFRHKSLISDIVTGGIFGLGSDGYILAIISMQKLLKK